MPTGPLLCVTGQPAAEAASVAEARGKQPFMFGRLSGDGTRIWFAAPARLPLGGPWLLTFLVLSGREPAARS